MVELYRLQEFDLSDVAAWLIKWAFDPVALDAMRRLKALQASNPDLDDVVELGRFFAPKLHVQLHARPSLLSHGGDLSEDKLLYDKRLSMALGAGIAGGNREKFVAAMESAKTRELVRKRLRADLQADRLPMTPSGVLFSPDSASSDPRFATPQTSEVRQVSESGGSLAY
jgi:hypothetical protein